MVIATTRAPMSANRPMSEKSLAGLQDDRIRGAIQQFVYRSTGPPCEDGWLWSVLGRALSVGKGGLDRRQGGGEFRRSGRRHARPSLIQRATVLRSETEAPRVYVVG